MRLRVLGSGAGGGVPQWNCRCDLCRLARTDPGRIRPRSHASIAISADGERWLVCNAGPDIHRQIEAFPPLLPREGARGTGIAAIALTGADLDQVLGLLLLREGDPLQIYGMPRVREALQSGLRLLPTLAAYGGAEWCDLVLDEERIVSDGAGRSLGLRLRAFAVAGGPPPYAGRREAGRPGDAIGLLIADEARGTSVAYVPSCGDVTEALIEVIGAADCVLFDGTLWRDDEIAALGVPGRTGRSMQHLPLAGADGALERLRPLTNRRILTHINNTNPLLREDGAERAAVAALGWEVAHDGLEVTL